RELSRVLDAPHARAVEVRADEHGGGRRRYEHDTGRTLRDDRLSADRRADGARRQDERLLLDIAVDRVDERRHVSAPAATAEPDRALVLQARLGIELNNPPPGRDTPRLGPRPP